MRGMSGHVVVACHSGEHEISWRVENRRIASRTSRRAFTLIPEGYDGHWEIGGPVEVSHVYLTQERVQACPDALIGDGKWAELLPRVSFEDPGAACNNYVNSKPYSERPETKAALMQRQRTL